MAKRDARIWDEFQGLDLGDNRRASRAVWLAEALAAAPASSLPELFSDPSDLEAAYRFLNNDEVDLSKLIAPHIRETIARSSERTIVVAHDTTVFTYAAGGKRRGLGNHRGAQEFRCHLALAISSDEARDPLGVLACETWVRDGGGGDGSEGARWGKQAITVSRLDGLDSARVIHVMDREADDYAMFVALKKEGVRFVVRGAIDRRLTTQRNGEHLREAMERIAVTTTRDVPLATRGKTGRTAEERKKFPQRSARIAKLDVTGATFRFPRPKSQPSDLPDFCELNVVRVSEPSPPEGEPAVEWLLYTTEPIDSADEVLAVVDAYRARWRIEELFKAIKTGCAFEQRQLESYDSLTAALGITLPIAWRILRLRSRAHEAPNEPATNLLAKDELAVLRAKLPKQRLGSRPTLAAALLAIAKLGGHLPQNGAPGWQTLHRGMKKLESLVEGYRLATRKRAPSRRPDQS